MDEFWRMAWRNLWRSPRRTLITLSAGALGLMFAQGYFNFAMGTYGGMIDQAVRAGAGHLALYAPGYLESREPAQDFDPGDLLGRVGRIEGVEVVLPRLYLPGLAQAARGSRGAVILGIDPVREWRVNPFARNLVEGRLIDGASGSEAVIGRELQESLKLKLGGKFVVMVQGPDGDIRSELLRVAGVLSTGLSEVDSRTVYVPLAFAGRLAGREGRLHEASVILGDQRDIPVVEAAIRGMLPAEGKIEVRPWQESMKELASHIRADTFTMKIFIWFIFLIVGIGVVNTLLMSVMERSREFGVMRALGVPTLFLLGMVVAEGLVMGLLAASSGSVLGTAATAALAHWGVDISSFYRTDRVEVSGVVISGVMRASWSAWTMARLALAVVVIYPLAAVYPAWRVTRLRPVESMKYT